LPASRNRDELLKVGAAHGRNEHRYAAEFSAPSSKLGFLARLDGVSKCASPGPGVGKPEIWFALALWGLCLDHGQTGNYPPISWAQPSAPNDYDADVVAKLSIVGFEEVEPDGITASKIGDIATGVFTPVLAKHSKSFSRNIKRRPLCGRLRSLASPT